jgi:hypothetical protein
MVTGLPELYFFNPFFRCLSLPFLFRKNTPQENRETAGRPATNNGVRPIRKCRRQTGDSIDRVGNGKLPSRLQPPIRATPSPARTSRKMADGSSTKIHFLAQRGYRPKPRPLDRQRRKAEIGFPFLDQQGHLLDGGLRDPKARIRTARDPFVQPGLFRNRSYSLGLAIAFLATATGYSLPFLVPQLLSEVHRLGPGPVGLSIVPAAVVTALLGKRGGKLADTKGNPFLFAVASCLLLVSFLLMSSFAGVSPILVAVFLMIGYVGHSFLLIALSNTVSRTIPGNIAESAWG